ncbi:hypothetical protein EBV26_20605, partial [bacterium]|nr:hypothetical protein [bacterium]
MNCETKTRCGFIYAKEFGRRCNKIDCNEHHFNIYLTIQKHVDVFVNDNYPILIDSIYECFDRLWNKYSDARNKESTADVLCYLYDKFMLYRLCGEITNKITRSLKKRDYANIMFDIYWNLWRINKNKRFVDYLLPKLQRRIRYGPHIMFKSNNIECPFSLTSLADLPEKELFSFYENKQVYTFHAPELHYYICKTYDYINPFTRQPINSKDIRRMFRLMKTKIEWKNMDKSWSSETLNMFLNDYCKYYNIPYDKKSNQLITYEIATIIYEDL